MKYIPYQSHSFNKLRSQSLTKVCLALLITFSNLAYSQDDVIAWGSVCQGETYKFKETASSPVTFTIELQGHIGAGNNLIWEYNTEANPMCIPTNAYESFVQGASNTKTTSFNNLISPGVFSDLVITPNPNTKRLNILFPANTEGIFSILVSVSEVGSVRKQKVFNIIIGRPLDLVLLLDRSGSMNQNTSAGPSRWTALTTAVTGFMNLYESLDLGGREDRIAIIYFDTDLDPLSVCCNDLIDINAGSSSTINVELGSQTVGGRTAFGTGLQNAQDKLNNINKSRTVLYFTDGEQNVAPEVNLDGRGYSDGVIIPGGNVLGNLKVFGIGIGNPSGNYLLTLQNLVSNNRGSLNISADGSNFIFDSGDPLGDLSAGFTSIFVNLLAKYSPQIIEISELDITPEDTYPMILQELPVNKRVDDLVFEIVFDRMYSRTQLENIASQISIFQNDRKVSQYAILKISTDTTNSLLLKFDFEYDSKHKEQLLYSEGIWRVQIDEISAFPKCRITSIVDDHLLDYQHSLGIKKIKVNDKLKPEVSLKWKGNPLTNASVYAEIIGYNQELGDALARYPYKVDPASSIDSGSPGVQKFDYLWLNDLNFRSLLESNKNAIQLKSDQNGNYSAEKAFKLSSAGVYKIRYHISENDTEIGFFQRTFSENFYVGYKNVDLNVQSINTINDNSIVIEVNPKTRYGTLLSAAGSGFNLLDSSSVISDVKDYQNGKYSLTFEGSLNSKNELYLFDEVIYKGKLNNIGNSLPWGLSIHGGITIPLNELDPLYDNGYYIEGDFSYQFTSVLSGELVIGNYGFSDEFSILGSGLFAKANLPNVLSGFSFTAAIGGGYYKPNNIRWEIGYALRGGVNKKIGKRWHLSLEGRYNKLQNINYSFATFGAGLSLKF